MKCMHCNCEFEPTKEEYRAIIEQMKHGGSSCIPFCSEECARVHLGKQFETQMKEHYHRLFHVGEKSEPPKFGTWEQRKIEREPGQIIVLNVNVGGRITTRPMTDAERENLERNRGRQTFSDHAKVCVLPSLSLHGKHKFDFADYR